MKRLLRHVKERWLEVRKKRAARLAREYLLKDVAYSRALQELRAGQ